MGCVASKRHVNTSNSNIFNVMNVDDNGEVISPGRLEVTDAELILHQKGKPCTRWPLSFLRKYGCDSELFTFECGRRCPTGQGIYAFRCKKAEQLFNLLQQNLNVENGNSMHINNGTVSVNSNPISHRRISSQPESYLNTVNSSITPCPRQISNIPMISDDVASVSPPIPFTAVINDTSLESNQEREEEHLYLNTKLSVTVDENPSNYANVNTVTSPTISEEKYMNSQECNSHFYMNINSSEIQNYDIFTNVDSDVESINKHCYANIGQMDEIGKSGFKVEINSKEINYAQLDLDSSEVNNDTKNNTSQLKIESPAKTNKSYVTIDFLKSDALSRSINNRTELEEGSRKTRHNSCINENDAFGKHRNSLSE